ncbi:A/G-specific adenine glycosylase [Staphylococcus saccharolyticus]|uniref:Adenine DNA glycosylase n=1 Tax=Staphylococcus saccharolyticus TaxID=33028 RepID=A0A380H3G0_9STAP|nr:A/G-specific adenine glycosylase [Staphylococcus saccharolyticus]MBL7565917.1 A/G-specific adenine glycosylase [Staphylococcus saccharolyticus]MBL7572356.1 A/G-specific adenine glycosylase [Staphylococcus saccharolyticus]QQB98495.1 A/G-specific adenine glycosylase [Staphylococcus saccharolyticus]QRJ67289.1 A/G-specific adenine glycosylase [Staphylococcus saccharolyticus]RTX92725.1 A/G-specific adenine glycosylase [Staphylococcus saccharolyticus]
MYQEPSFKKNIVDWFDKNQRDMPWRETTNPYYIWLSEVMLQQTQVNTVVDYYHKFITRFPSIKSLSDANEDDVLKYWEGLGYYSRVRNFHTAIKEVNHKHGGEVPTDPEIFKKLKGVGPYTLAAVMSIAFNHPLATVDGNVFRVWSRLNNDFRDTKLQTTRKAYETELKPYVQDNSGTFNQAMMELGALICTPKSPLCLFCPVQDHCEAFHNRTTQELPVKTKNIKKRTLNQKVFLIRNDEGKYLLEKRKDKLLNGMWQFPMREASVADNKITKDIGIKIETIKTPIFELRHQFTHMTWNIKVYSVPNSINLSNRLLPDNYTWFDLDDREQYTFPVSMDKIYQFIVG